MDKSHVITEICVHLQEHYHLHQIYNYPHTISTTWSNTPDKLSIIMSFAPGKMTEQNNSPQKLFTTVALCYGKNESAQDNPSNKGSHVWRANTVTDWSPLSQFDKEAVSPANTVTDWSPLSQFDKEAVSPALLPYAPVIKRLQNSCLSMFTFRWQYFTVLPIRQCPWHCKLEADWTLQDNSLVSFCFQSVKSSLP